MFLIRATAAQTWEDRDVLVPQRTFGVKNELESTPDRIRLSEWNQDEARTADIRYASVHSHQFEDRRVKTLKGTAPDEKRALLRGIRESGMHRKTTPLALHQATVRGLDGWT